MARGPYFFAELSAVTAAEEQAAIDARETRLAGMGLWRAGCDDLKQGSNVDRRSRGYRWIDRGRAVEAVGNVPPGRSQPGVDQLLLRR